MVEDRERILISYRQESFHVVRRLLHKLSANFDPADIQMRTGFPSSPSADYAQDLERVVAICDVLLAVIDPGWLVAEGTDEWRRPDLLYVHAEIAVALERDIPVIPVLVEGAVLPRRKELPQNLAGLRRRRAVSLRHESFDSDSDRLVRRIERVLRDPYQLYERVANSTVASPPYSPAEPFDELPLLSKPGPPLLPEPEDVVSFTAGYPGTVAPLIWYSLSLYVHLGRLQSEVDRQIANESRRFGLRPAISNAPAHVRLPKGTQLQISPRLHGVEFNPPVQEIRWLEDIQQIEFRMRAAPDVAGRAVLGAVEVRTGPLLVGQVPLSIGVRSADEPQERAEAMATATGKVFDSIFASYAHQDARVVRAFAEAYRAVGINLLMDKASLRAGEDWQEALLRLIREADLFQLFWSETASRSRNVTKEWRHALSLQDHKGERFIRPLYWESPLPSPPAQLAHLHFANFDLLALASVTERSSSQTGSPIR